MKQFQNELTKLINRHSLENESNTPDYILSDYLVRCLKNFNEASVHRVDWHGSIPREVLNTDLRDTLDRIDAKFDKKQ